MRLKKECPRVAVDSYVNCEAGSKSEQNRKGNNARCFILPPKRTRYSFSKFCLDVEESISSEIIRLFTILHALVRGDAGENPREHNLWMGLRSLHRREIDSFLPSGMLVRGEVLTFDMAGIITLERIPPVLA